METIAYIYIPAFFILLTYYLIRPLLRSDLNTLPGPSSAKFSRLWLLKTAKSGALHKTAISVHNEYGPVVRVGPNHVWVNDPEEITQIYGINSTFRKSAFYTMLGSKKSDAARVDLFTCIDPAVHKAKKRNVSNAYAMSSMLTLEPLVDECVDILFSKFSDMEKLQALENVDLGKWLQWYAFDVIGEITFSKRFGFMEEGRDVSGMIKGLETSLVYTGVVGQVPEMHGLMKANPVWGSYFRKGSSIATIAPFTQKQIANHSELSTSSQVNSRDFLSRLRDLQKEYPDRVDDQDIFGLCMSNLLAGSDTTAISLRAVLYHLVKNPRAYHALRAEIDAFDARGDLSPVPTFAQSLRMTYLQAAMKEALRLHPGVGFPLERVVPAGGATISGHRLKEGTIVGMNAWALHRRQSVFGSDADYYRPERWIEAHDEQLKAMDRSFFSFGHGPRACIGKNISVLEMSKVLPQLLRYYDVQMAKGPEAEWKIHNYWFARQTDMIVKMTRRDRSNVGGEKVQLVKQ